MGHGVEGGGSWGRGRRVHLGAVELHALELARHRMVRGVQPHRLQIHCGERRRWGHSAKGGRSHGGPRMYEEGCEG